MRDNREATSRTRIGGILAVLALLAAAALPLSAAAAPLHTQTAFSPITGSGTGDPLVVPDSAAADEANGNIFVVDGTQNFERSDNPTHPLGTEGGVPAGVAPPYKISDGF